jgi:hypothetical protein
LEETQKLQLHDLLIEYQDLFISTNSEIVGTNTITHHIDTGDTPPISNRPYRLSYKENEILKNEIDAMLTSNIIEPSDSPWTSPVVLVKKKDGTIRFCVDYRKLNKVTKISKWPLPNIEDCLRQLSGSQYYSQLDLFSGYWQIKMEPNSKEKTTFICHFGTYQFKVMPFGLVNAPSTFSRMMHQNFKDLLTQYLVLYLDDLTVFSKNFSDHLPQLKNVFERLRKTGLKLKLKKCHFAQHQILFLGHNINKDGIGMNPSKIINLQNTPIPKNIKQLRSFLGLCNYFRKFIANFSEIALPLTELTKTKSNPYYKWTNKHTNSFHSLKEKLISPPILSHFNPKIPIFLSCDASNFAVGATLEQQINDNLHPIGYFSAKMTSCERNYTIMEKELLAIVKAVKFFRPELYGNEFLIFTDNSAVASILNIPMPQGRIARWILFLTEFKYSIQHRKGKDNIVADFLSRKSFSFFSAVQSELFSDSHLMAIYEFLKTGNNSKELNSSSLMKYTSLFCVHSDTLYRKYKTHLRKVLFSSDIIPILTSLHDNFGHFGTQSVFDFMKTRYWCKNLYHQVKQFVTSCTSCQQFQFKYPDYKFNGTFGSSGIFDVLSIDFIGPFPISNGNVFIITAILPSIRYPFAKAVPSATAKEAMLFLVSDVIPFIGCPRRIVSDQGSHFNNNTFSLLCDYLKIKHKMMPAYTPELNPFVERFNQTLQYSLFKMVYHSLLSTSDWTQFIPSVIFYYRVRRCPDLKYSPFFLLFGTQPTLPIDLQDTSSILFRSLDSRIIELDPLFAIRYDLIRTPNSSDNIPIFILDNIVWLLDSQIRKKNFKLAKFQPRYIGPYKISSVLPHNMYVLRSQTGEISKPIHVSRLIPFIPRSVTSDLQGGVSRVSTDTRDIGKII